MKHLFCIVGLSCSGKSTLVKSFTTYSIDRFHNDALAKNIALLLNITPPFPLTDPRQWGHLARRANLELLKYLLYILLFKNSKREAVIGEGYMYYFQSERLALEKAVHEIFGKENVKVHYLHLRQSLERLNTFCDQRGYPHYSQEKYDKLLNQLPQDFFDATIANTEDAHGYMERFAALEKLPSGEETQFLNIKLPEEFVNSCGKLEDQPEVQDIEKKIASLQAKVTQIREEKDRKIALLKEENQRYRRHPFITLQRQIVKLIRKRKK